MAVKAIILIGGPNKGQRFRPLSFNSPKYMFPVGGQTIIEHLIESCLKLDDLAEIILLGFYQKDDEVLSNLQTFARKINQRYAQESLNKKQTRKQIPNVVYLPEFTPMGTAGGLCHFRDQIRHGNPEAFLVINGDVCGDFDFDRMLAQHYETIKRANEKHTPKPYITVMVTEAERQESLNYGCIVDDPETHSIKHYVEKPSTFVSNLINCGAYVCSCDLLDLLEATMRKKRNEFLKDCTSTNSSRSHPDYLSLELDVLQDRSSQAHCFSYKTKGSWWCQVKTAASAIYANRYYLKSLSNTRDGQRGGKEARDCSIIGDVYIHPTAIVDPSSVIGPNVSIMENCMIGAGVRIKESIILQNAVINANSLILCSIVGWKCTLGNWVRVEGTPSEPDPNQKFAKVQNPPLFNPDGKLNPSISVLGCNVKISGGTVIINSIVLPDKEIARSYMNEIVL